MSCNGSHLPPWATGLDELSSTSPHILVSELLDQAGEPERSYISAMMMSFTTATAQYAQNGKV